MKSTSAVYGRLTLKLSPGKYKLRGDPLQDIIYIRTELDFAENEQGEVRAVAIPGAGSYGIGPGLPDGYEPADPQEQFQGRTIDLPMGGIVHETFKLRKKGAGGGRF